MSCVYYGYVLKKEKVKRIENLYKHIEAKQG